MKEEMRNRRMFVYPKRLYDKIVSLVGKRGENQFIVEAIEQKLETGTLRQKVSKSILNKIKKLLETP